jgi:hypothetical protein
LYIITINILGPFQNIQFQIKIFNFFLFTNNKFQFCVELKLLFGSIIVFSFIYKSLIKSLSKYIDIFNINDFIYNKKIPWMMKIFPKL